MQSSKHILGGMLLVSGTSIGAGMLALPLVTAAGGFLPSVLIYLLCWGFMTATGLLILELCLKMPEGVNLISLAERFLGGWGKGLSWALYIFLFYSLSVAYISGGSELLFSMAPFVPRSLQLVLFVVVFSSLVYLGAKWVDRVNRLLMVGLLGVFFVFVGICTPLVEMSLLQRENWLAPWMGMPIIFTSFSYQGVIPSLVSYLKRDVRGLRWAIIGGTTLTFLIYLLWQCLILGTIPLEGEGGLLWAKEHQLTAIHPLKYQVDRPILSFVGQSFAFFAITTSFLGVTLGLFDFLADGLKISKKGIHRVQLLLLTFAPPLIITLWYPSLFLKALQMAGGIGCALLLGLLPILMGYRSRYLGRKTDLTYAPILGGGKFLLGLLLLFVCFELSIELWLELK